QQYSNPNDAALIATAGLDQAMVGLAQAFPQWNVSIARGFSAFATVATLLGGGDSCKAGLLYRLPDGTCNIHPSRFGHTLLAAAVANAAPPPTLPLHPSPPAPASSIDLNASPPQF